MYGTITKPFEYTYSNANTVGGFGTVGYYCFGLLQIQLKLGLYYYLLESLTPKKLDL